MINFYWLCFFCKNRIIVTKIDNDIVVNTTSVINNIAHHDNPELFDGLIGFEGISNVTDVSIEEETPK